MFKPLDGVKVIDLTYFVAGPGAARILADWGADVIKVEPSFGDPGRGTGATMSCPTVKDCNPFYTAYNANKRGLSLNLKSDEGKAVLYKLLESADVFVSSYRTGALKRLGLDYDSLSKKFPHLIWAQINGFGDFGPAKDNAGFDTVAFWARSGAMIDITEKDTSPVNPLIGFGDATTSCSLSGGICAALYQKAKTGKGCKVMVSLFAQAIWSESAGMVSTQYGDEYPKTRLNPGSPVMDTFKSADDKWFYMSILEPDRYNDALMKELGRNDLVGDPRYCTAVAAKAHSSELVEILSAEFAKHTMDEIAAMFARADIAYDRVQHIKEVLDDPQALENMYIIPVENRDGTVTKQPMTPIRFATTEPARIEDIAPTMERQAPLVGEHSAEILKEHGYTDEDIQKLVDSKVVYIEKL
ncbi:CaiB/BaiF CoA transferase family protein [Intestinimonas butyriciproducens]|mgnify:FL=1|uniref:CaiB/BaiF CoA transferase family protein n=1 Tax=Intestinimonas butyriciproducens TaxID=1297617 RepID=UPI00082231A4|nr:CaiB/BaiF CoA-transferase family protein [Intestinimonas butyriciproducens]SCI73003.1 Formyl-coenzyme A transferase [uncultured Clostridium sp.]MBU5229264.1 CoA transferase [Intestinimonas butyriciproducens]MCI6362226.1 CoA transferase [Intestinimonas butyriciproducens]MDB7829785.1 CaiB/BaiF CoA-transferase family protein [Intestinimonas butyriciproducens]MDB7859867.1 CaiB/BaiF CoA-transferase family protein [Intestinimonas butyriciproducens]